jgi:hypothetical protein
VGLHGVVEVAWEEEEIALWKKVVVIVSVW